ncbi:MAG: hypothetical protein ILP09_01395 [Oscillospiraceae bacterium]|nr:hypothetical protein [Oscillospiraceae bacterium]
MNSASFLKGMGAGLIVGMAAGMVAAPKKKKSRAAGRMLKSLGNIVDGVGGALGL